MLRIIINADDLGMSEDVNRSIAECFETGYITSTTLMVNMDHADEGVRLAREQGWADKVGLHLNFTSGMPLTQGIRSHRRFCGEDGSFNQAFFNSLPARLHISRAETDAVRAEAEAQINKYLSYGMTNLHLDSHHYVHTDASIWNAVEPLVVRYGIRSVRLTRNLYRDMSLLKKTYKRRFNRRLGTLGVRTTDYFGSFEDFMDCHDSIGDGALVEIMVHPMHDDEGVLVDTRKPIQEERDFLTGIGYAQEFY